MVVTEHIGDIFAAPEGSVLIRKSTPLALLYKADRGPDSNNCQGDWGAGVAAAFKAKVCRDPMITAGYDRATANRPCQFPAAYQVYHDHCTIPGSTHVKKLLLGTCLLIPPQPTDVEKSGRYWIACLMTSLHYGRRVDKPDVILENTRKALTAMRTEMQKAERSVAGLSFEGTLYTVRMNGKAFKTPWPLTRRVLANSRLDVRVMNNVDVMDRKERQQVLEQMEQSGDDLEKVRAIREGREIPEEAPRGTKEDKEDETLGKEDETLDKERRVRKPTKRKSVQTEAPEGAEVTSEKAGGAGRKKKHKSLKEAA